MLMTHITEIDAYSHSGLDKEKTTPPQFFRQDISTCLNCRKLGQFTIKNNQNYCHKMLSLYDYNALNSISTGASPQTPLGRLQRFPSLLAGILRVLLLHGKGEKVKVKKKKNMSEEKEL